MCSTLLGQSTRSGDLIEFYSLGTKYRLGDFIVVYALGLTHNKAGRFYCVLHSWVKVQGRKILLCSTILCQSISLIFLSVFYTFVPKYNTKNFIVFHIHNRTKYKNERSYIGLQQTLAPKYNNSVL